VAALLLATAFPEWVALQRAERSSSYQLRQGRGAVLTADSGGPPAGVSGPRSSASRPRAGQCPDPARPAPPHLLA
jgi:hypothetical protein